MFRSNIIVCDISLSSFKLKKRYRTSLVRISSLIGKQLVISNRIFSCELKLLAIYPISVAAVRKCVPILPRKMCANFALQRLNRTTEYVKNFFEKQNDAVLIVPPKH